MPETSETTETTETTETMQTLVGGLQKIIEQTRQNPTMHLVPESTAQEAVLSQVEGLLLSLGLTGPLPVIWGLCNDRDQHEPHPMESSMPTPGRRLWCSADQTKREPFASEQRQRRRVEARSAG